MLDNPYIPKEFIEFLRYSAFAGFIVSAALLVMLDYKAFKRVFKERVNEMRWVFIASTLLLLLIILYIFTFLFQKLGISLF